MGDAVKTKKHNGIEYKVLKRFKPINNEYELLGAYTIQLNIKGYEVSSKHIRLTKSGFLIFYPGFLWDGPSGPTWDTKTFMRGSLIHDGLYRFVREQKLPWWVRAYADALLYQIALEDGMNKIRAKYVYRAVCKYGVYAVMPLRSLTTFKE